MAEHEDRLYRLEATEVFKDFRGSFADDVATELAFKGDEGLSEFVQELAETVAAFLNFCNDVLAHYIATRPPESHRYVS